ncbi:MAG: hypothetical protein IT208_12890 [Chthonomonadales bacterium]|nr:hypothetical protein [Chthonomonadales bacterium]
MTDTPACPHCAGPLAAGDFHCPRCGGPTGRIEWSLSSGREPALGPVVVRPGESFYLVASNSGEAGVRVTVDASAASGVRLTGAPSLRVDAGASQAFAFAHLVGSEPGGALTVRSEDAPRREWWERRSWRERKVRLAPHVRVRDERWVLGSATLVFPAGVRRQRLCVWNDSERPRALETQTPAGFRVTHLGTPLGLTPIAAPAGECVELALEMAPDTPGAPDAQWAGGPAGQSVPIVRLPMPAVAPGADLVVAMDFGTRNTRVRVRWRRALVATRPAGAVDAVGDRGDAPWFPSEMVLDERERGFRWGSDAARHSQLSPLAAGEVHVENLKTDLREGTERYTRHRPEWTNEELLRRFFARILHRVDELLRTIDPAQPLAREALDVRYVVCRPVLDANEGDERGRAYEVALRGALARCGVPERAVEFVLEPVAAMIGIARRRDSELLGLPEGTPIALIDSGGGTTDVVLARLRVGNGQVGLDVAGSYALRIGAGNPAMRLPFLPDRDRREVGGNVLDYALAHCLLTRAADVLEADGRPAPSAVLRVTGKEIDLPWLREFVAICRRMKERFARASTLYLNRAPGEGASEAAPFPNRPELQGVRLVHALYDEHIAGPILRPVVEEFLERVVGAQTDACAVLPSQVKRAFYVGGTNVDPFVRRHFGRAFALAQPESDADPQSDERIAERLEAVVEGAVWFDERIFASSPLALSLVTGAGETSLLEEGAALPPAGIAFPRFVTVPLAPGEEIAASLVASGGGLPGRVVVARAFYRNEADEPQEAVLAVTCSRDRGVCAALQVDGRKLEQWRFVLTEDGQ